MSFFLFVNGLSGWFLGIFTRRREKCFYRLEYQKKSFLLGDMEKLQKFASLIALIALVLGGAGLALGFIAFQRTQDGDVIITIKDSISTLSESMTDVQAKVSSQTAEYVTKDNLRTIATQTQDAFNAISDQLSKMRTQSRGDAIKIAEMEAKLENFQGPRAKPKSPVVVSDEAMEQTTANENGTISYKIQSGDTLGKVAKEFGITLDTLLSANPGVQPRYLQLGQEVIIPAN